MTEVILSIVERRELEKDEVDAKVPAPTDAEIQKLFEDNKDDLQGQTLEQVKPQIVEYIKGEKGGARFEIRV